VVYGSVSADSLGRNTPKPNRAMHLAPELRERIAVFHLLACNVACLAIASLYYVWRDLYRQRRKRQQLHDRVAYMLWVAANRAN
jgi:hypothetical protein